MTVWIAIAISVGALVVAAISLRETQRLNKRELRANLLVESVIVHRPWAADNDLLIVTLRNVGRADAVALESSIFLGPVCYRSRGLAQTIFGGGSIDLNHKLADELATGVVVCRPHEPDGHGGFTGEPGWVFPKGSQIKLRFTDASGPHEVAFPLQG